ncbi:MAG: hypothetical protein HRU80_08985 [Ignavibacteriales bacterium]|nr:MAG: hypothetical protein HRU80_08985 [Ignavibacteriales bacterium]
MKKFIVFLPLFLVLLVSGCDAPEAVVEPTHFTRVPVPINLAAITDTTETGKIKVTLTWGVPSTQNLRNFEVYRTTLAKTNRYFPLIPTTTTTTFVDSFSVTFTDTFKVYYYITPTGEDRFIGRNSDTLYVPITK